MNKILRHRKPTKETSGLLTFAYFWRFYLVFLPLAWLLDSFVGQASQSVGVFSLHFIVSFTVSTLVMFYLIKYEFKFHRIKLYYKEDVLNYILQSAIYDDFKKPVAIPCDFEILFKLSWSFYWRSAMYIIVFMIAYYAAVFTASLLAGVVIALLNLDDHTETIIFFVQIISALLAIFVYFQAMARSFVKVLENGFFEYYLKIAKIEEAVSFESDAH